MRLFSDPVFSSKSFHNILSRYRASSHRDRSVHSMYWTRPAQHNSLHFLLASCAAQICFLGNFATSVLQEVQLLFRKRDELAQPAAVHTTYKPVHIFLWELQVPPNSNLHAQIVLY